MGKNTANIVAALGAGILGYQQQQKINEQIAASKEDRAAKQEDRAYAKQLRETEQAYRSEKQAVAQQFTQQAAAAGDDENAKRKISMTMYENLGLLDAKYGKAGIADLEAARKTRDTMKAEGELDAYGHYLTTGDMDGAIARFNSVGSKKVAKANAVDDVDPVTGTKFKRMEGEFEDGSKFGYNPLVAARQLGGVAGMMREAKEAQAKQEGVAAEDRAQGRQLALVEAQGKNAARVAGIGASNGAQSVALQRDQFNLAKEDREKLTGLQTEYAAAQEAGDDAKAKKVFTRIQIATGQLGKDKQTEIKVDKDGGLGFVVNGVPYYKGQDDKEARPLLPQSSGGPAEKGRTSSGGGVMGIDMILNNAKLAVGRGDVTPAQANAELEKLYAKNGMKFTPLKF